MKPGGVLGVNISNRYLDLEPIVAGAASRLGWSGVVVNDDGYQESYYLASTWALVSPSPRIFKTAGFTDESVEQIRADPKISAWTDDYSNIIQILK